MSQHAANRGKLSEPASHAKVRRIRDHRREDCRKGQSLGLASNSTEAAFCAAHFICEQGFVRKSKPTYDIYT